MSDSTASGAADGKGEGRRGLRDALRQARIEAADRTGVVVDLRDAEVARLEILSEALDPLFGEILVKSLNKFKVPKAEQKEIASVLLPMRKDIVTR